MKSRSPVPTGVLAAIIAVMGGSACAEETPQTRNGLPLIFEEDFESGDGCWSLTDPNAWTVIEEDGDHVPALQPSLSRVHFRPLVHPDMLQWYTGSAGRSSRMRRVSTTPGAT